MYSPLDLYLNSIPSLPKVMPVFSALNLSPILRNYDELLLQCWRLCSDFSLKWSKGYHFTKYPKDIFTTKKYFDNKNYF